jgi:hypothetical protein
MQAGAPGFSPFPSTYTPTANRDSVRCITRRELLPHDGWLNTNYTIHTLHEPVYRLDYHDDPRNRCWQRIRCQPVDTATYTIM